MAQRLPKLASTAEGIRDAQRQLVERFENYRTPQFTIDKIRNAFIDIAPKKAVPASEREVAWLKFPYHPLYARNVQKLISNLNNDEGLASMFREARGTQPPRLCIAWCNSSPNLNSMVRRSVFKQPSINC